MNMLLTDQEVRVLGCLMEKEMATPEYYPLSLNALVNACNQKSNREPVVSFDEETVLFALNSLMEVRAARKSEAGRVTKYEQIFTEKMNLLNRESAVVCILLLRGPQTVGEVRGRTERLYSFKDLEEVQSTIASLEDMNLLCRLPRQPGRKEHRYSHLLSGDPVENQMSSPAKENSKVIIRRADESTVQLQDEIDNLRRELQELREEFVSFRSQFE